MKVTFWFAARKREFKNIKTQEMEEKIEEIYKTKLRNEITRSGLELKDNYRYSAEEQLSQMRDNVKLNKVTRETLKDQITKMKIEIEEQQWQQLMLAEANRMAEETGMKIEDYLANRIAEETGMKIEDCLATANKLNLYVSLYASPND